METQPFSADRSFARRLDATDALAGFRRRFHLPPGTIYFNGNSLGLASVDGVDSVQRAIDQWKVRAVGGWLDGEDGWFDLAERVGARVAPLVGAAAEEVVATGTTTVNLHALLATFYEPRAQRTKILADASIFPSDLYAIESHVEFRGLAPKDHVILVSTRQSGILDDSQVVTAMSPDVAVAVLPSVVFRTGQLLDIERLTREAHSHGILIGIDCSHSAGAIAHHFDAWGVDFAFWGSYKYLNGGPGSPAFIYVNPHHFTRRPAMRGWWGYVKDRQFEMRPEFEPAPGAGGWQISTPGILGLAAVDGAVSVIVEAGIDRIREKSLRMTAYLMDLVDERLRAFGFSVLTPQEANRRGAHVALKCPAGALDTFEALEGRGVVVDFRPPDVMRLCPSPLYNTFDEVWRVVETLRVVASGVPGQQPD